MFAKREKGIGDVMEWPGSSVVMTAGLWPVPDCSTVGLMRRASPSSERRNGCVTLGNWLSDKVAAVGKSQFFGFLPGC